MATSGDTDFNLTRNEIIRLALLECNGIEPEETVETQQQDDAAKLLNMFVKRVSAKKPLFGVIDITIPLYDSKESYTVGPAGDKNTPRPVAITQARRRDSSGNDTPIFQISRSDYMDLTLKSSTGLVNQFCYDKQLTQGILYVWPVSSATSVSLSDGATDQWTDSPAVTGEYYYTGADITAEPSYVFAAGTELTEGTLGSLANGEYAWGDNDALGTDTLYVKTTLGDPDGQVSGYIKVLTSVPDRIILTTHRPLEDFSTSSDNPDFPQDALEMLVMNLAAKLAIQYAPERVMIIKQEAMQLYADYIGSDNEDVGFTVRPQLRGY